MLVITYAIIGISSWGYELDGSIGWSDELDGVMEVVLTLQPHLYAGYYLCIYRDLILAVSSTYTLPWYTYTPL